MNIYFESTIFIQKILNCIIYYLCNKYCNKFWAGYFNNYSVKKLTPISLWRCVEKGYIARRVGTVARAAHKRFQRARVAVFTPYMLRFLRKLYDVGLITHTPQVLWVLIVTFWFKKNYIFLNIVTIKIIHNCNIIYVINEYELHCSGHKGNFYKPRLEHRCHYFSNTVQRPYFSKT